MPSCSTAKNPRGVTITFTESDHKYTSIVDGKEINYISGTTFISKFFPPFDPTGCITRACARKRGLTVEALKQQWREKADKSCVFGTKIHESVEDTLHGNPLRNKPLDTKEELTMKNAVNLGHKVLERFDILGIEKIIFDERLKIAGTMDLFVKSKQNGRYWIFDHKTNASIDKENKYNKFGLHPIEHVPDTNFYHYQMQLQLYEYLLKEVGYIPKDADVGKCLFHITEKGVKTYQLGDYSKEIVSMVEEYKKGLN